MIAGARGGAGTEETSATALTRLAKAHAYAIGFDLVGIAALGPAETSREFEAWLAEGRAGTMHYLARGAEKRRDSRLPLPGTTHAIVVALFVGRLSLGPERLRVDALLFALQPLKLQPKGALFDLARRALPVHLRHAEVVVGGGVFRHLRNGRSFEP